MASSNDDIEALTTQLDAEILLFRNEIERQLKQRLVHLVESYEKDRKDNLDRFLLRTFLNYPEGFERRVKSAIPLYVFGINYSQGHSCSVGFTASPPPGAWTQTVDLNDIARRAIPVDNNEVQIMQPRPEPSKVTNEHRSNTSLFPSQKMSTRAGVNPQKPKTFLFDGVRPRWARRRREPFPSSLPLSLRKPTPQTIRTCDATMLSRTRPSWAFAYDLGDGAVDHYILVCPKAGCEFAFSKHPFENQLATNHFGECGVSYSDEDFIVRHYGRRVVQGKRPELDEDWLTKYNQMVTETANREDGLDRKSSMSTGDLFPRASMASSGLGQPPSLYTPTPGNDSESESDSSDDTKSTKPASEYLDVA